MEATPHILVVDDHRDIREPLAAHLEKNGCRASMTADAMAARRVIDRAAIDLVVLDIMIPGEDGLSLCRHLRETTQFPSFSSPPGPMRRTGSSAWKSAPTTM